MASKWEATPIKNETPAQACVFVNDEGVNHPKVVAAPKDQETSTPALIVKAAQCSGDLVKVMYFPKGTPLPNGIQGPTGKKVYNKACLLWHLDRFPERVGHHQERKATFNL